jgi:hypothetical protein
MSEESDGPIANPLPPWSWTNSGGNVETRLGGDAGGSYITPNDRFYVRNNA